MTAVTLPASPGPRDFDGWPIDFGGLLTPGLGGPVQRINRLGNRLGVSVKLPPMEPHIARPWISRLHMGLQDGVIWLMRQPGLVIGSPGTVLVNGGGQAGRVLAVDGAASSYTFQDGQFVSLLTGGQSYLYMLAADVTASSGAATLAFTTPLRAEPADNDPVEVAAPVITGWLGGDSGKWTVDTARHFGLAFSIEEAA